VKTWLVTGGAGFIGSAFVQMARARGLARVVTLDLLTYAGNLENLEPLAGDPDHVFVRGDIGDRELVGRLLAEHRPLAVVNFAAESHVDRSIHDASPFLRTNVLGTQALLESVRAHRQILPGHEQDALRFLHVSTDEVYGSLGPGDPPFTERSRYEPNSPYAASKAASDHLVRAAVHTHGLPAIVTNGSNTYGPRQFPEKLVPLMILNAREGRPLPVYGDGLQVRDWLHVEDHAAGVLAALERGVPGETYNIGGGCERTNIEIVRTICAILDGVEPAAAPRERLLRHVADRPGHDRRYALDTSKARGALGWEPARSFDQGLRATVLWYLENGGWVERVRSGAYREWIAANYARRGAAAGEGGAQ
jgi:dTDP-glucose 4,6-dehydratase